MCDYSLEAYRSRPAQQGETYQTHRFPSQTVGFVAPSDTETAVCVACDMTLRLAGIPEGVQTSLGVSAIENVTFTRLDTEHHRDGVRFANGAEATLQQLGPGVTAMVTDALLAPPAERELVQAV